MKNVRTCIACREKKNKSEMLRIVKNKNGEIAIDSDQKKDGRGAYVCNCEECKKKLVKSKALNRSFKSAICPEIYDKLGERFGDK